MPALSHQHNVQDEDYINKSLLASLDDDPDNASIHDFAAATSYGSTSSSSDSPSLNYPATVHNHQQQSSDLRHHSENHNLGDPNSIPSLPSFYQNSSSIHSHHEFNADYDPLKFHQSPTSLNDFVPTTSTKYSFTSYPNTTRFRHQTNISTPPTASFCDSQPYYPTTSTSDIYPPHLSSHIQPFDSYASYDYSSAQSVNATAHKKNFADQYSTPPTAHVKPPVQQLLPNLSAQSQYTNGIHLSSQTPYGPHVPSNIAGNVPSNPGAPPGLISSNITNGSNTAINGEEISTIFVVGFPEDMQEREFHNMFTFSPGFEAATLKIPNKEFTSYGGLIGGAASSAVSPGGGGVNGIRGAFHYAGLNDPYNMVTVNQGGVVVDGGRDGGMASWPAAAPLNVNDDLAGSHYLSPGINLSMSGLNASGAPSSGGNLPPRKQIIGFAKFRSREEALTARDVLQGRRVDIEKGAVLKAEMAKKNLHTKRGVGSIPGGGGSSMQQSQGQQQTNALDSFDNYREREHTVSSLPPTSLAHLSRLGWRPVMTHSQQNASINGLMNGSSTRVDEEPKRDGENSVAMALSMGLSSVNTNSTSSASSTVAAGTIATHGARERAEGDGRERRRKEKEMKEKEKERELNLMRLRASNSVAYDAFHGVSVGITMSRQSSAGIGRVNETQLESIVGSSSLLGEIDTGQQHQSVDEVVGPWDRNSSMDATTVGRPRSTSQYSSSPPPIDDNPHEVEYEREYDEYQLHIQAQHQREDSPGRYMSNENGSVLDDHSDDHGIMNAPLHNDSNSRSELVLNKSGLHRLQRIGQYQHHPQVLQQQRPGSQTSSSGGGRSPQLPSPTSGDSTTSAMSANASLRGTVDQNPPINTLYVGNLPTSPPPNGFPQDYLEDTLREIFSARPGYRKLCFRQKSNGPMCFVEFEDVHHATKAIVELSGNTLRGAVKNGIRLSYSKNPLGVRTPTSADTGAPTLQQQQQLVQTLHNHHLNHHQQLGSGDGGLGHPRMDDYGAATPPHRGHQQTQIHPRRDTTSSTTLNQGHLQSFIGGSNNNINNHNFLFSPPPRFYSTSPGSGMDYGPPTTTTTAVAAVPTSSSTPLSGASSAFIPRANGDKLGGGHSRSHAPVGGNGSWAPSPPSFSPFGMVLAGESYQSHIIPGDHHLHQQLQSGPAAIDH